MPTNKTEIVETPAPAAETSAPTVVAVTPSSRRLPALAIAGITLGGVLVAGLLFGGGVLVGTHLQARGEFGTHQGFDSEGFPGGPNGQGGGGFPGGPDSQGGNGFPTGPNGQGGPGPVFPGDGQNGTPRGDQGGTQQDGDGS